MKFVQKLFFLFINNYLQSNSLCQRFFQSSKHFWKLRFGIANSYDFSFSFLSSVFSWGTTLRYNTLTPTFFAILETLLKRAFWYRQQLLFRFFFYLLNRSKTLSFPECLRFWEEQKVSASQVRWIRWLRHDYGFVFGQKFKHKHWCVS